MDWVAMVIVFILYVLAAVITLVVTLVHVRVDDFIDFTLVLPLSLFGAVFWPVTLVLFGLYTVVKA